MSAYHSSRDFTALTDEAGDVVAKLGTVRYALNIKDTRVTVTPDRDEPDYAKEIETFFAKFNNGTATEHMAAPPDQLNMNEVEAKILEVVAPQPRAVRGAGRIFPPPPRLRGRRRFRLLSRLAVLRCLSRLHRAPAGGWPAVLLPETFSVAGTRTCQ